jgi:hypothetical protein
MSDYLNTPEKSSNFFGGAAAGISAGSAFGDVAQGFATASGEQASGQYTQQQFNFNARLAELQAADAVKRGEKSANILRKRASQYQGSQRAGYAGQGVDVNFGTPLDVQKETQDVSAEDARTIVSNSWREAFGLQSLAESLRGQGRFASLAARNRSTATILTGVTRGVGNLARAGYYGYEGGLFGPPGSAYDVNAPQLQPGYDIYSEAPSLL